MDTTADPTKEENDMPEVSEDSLKLIVHNHSFYFKDDPMAIFLVENQLFKVHRHYFIEGSEVFRDMFSIPKAEAMAAGGACDEQVPLPEVTVEEFETLLNFFYSFNEGTVDPPDAQKKREVNLRLLSISHRFLFDSVFKYAAQQLHPQEIPVVDRIRLGDKYEIQTWLCSAYEELLDRPEPLSEEEANALGINRIVRFVRAKDDMHRERLRIAGVNCQHQTARAAYAELCWANRGFAFTGYQVPPSQTPAQTQLVARRYFFETQ